MVPYTKAFDLDNEWGRSGLVAIKILSELKEKTYRN